MSIYLQKMKTQIRKGRGRVGRRSKREARYVYIELIHFIVQQKLTKHCKAAIPKYKRCVRPSVSSIAVLFTIGKIQKQPKCLLIGE